MKTLAITILTLAACADDGPLPASEDPRTVQCETFRMPGYEGPGLPLLGCHFDVADLDLFEGSAGVLVIGDYCGQGCGSLSQAEIVSGTTWKAAAIDWTGDEEFGVAVLVGDGTQCIWTRCLRVE